MNVSLCEVSGCASIVEELEQEGVAGRPGVQLGKGYCEVPLGVVPQGVPTIARGDVVMTGLPVVLSL